MKRIRKNLKQEVKSSSLFRSKKPVNIITFICKKEKKRKVVYMEELVDSYLDVNYFQT